MSKVELALLDIVTTRNKTRVSKVFVLEPLGSATMCNSGVDFTMGIDFNQVQQVLAITLLFLFSIASRARLQVGARSLGSLSQHGYGYERPHVSEGLPPQRSSVRKAVASASGQITDLHTPPRSHSKQAKKTPLVSLAS